MRTFLILFSFFLTCCSPVVHANIHLIIFSKDRPTQLTALLESLAQYTTGLSHITVLYHAQNKQYGRAYKKVQNSWPSIRFIQQHMKRPRSDFAPLLKKIIYSLQTRYILFAVDDMVVIDTIDFEHCAQLLSQSHAYGFYLRLGKDIDYCYMTRKETRLPAFTTTIPETLMWLLRAGEGDWGYHFTVDMTIYHRETILSLLNSSDTFTTPNQLEACWAARPIPAHLQGICYHSARVVNIPLNRVQTDFANPCSNHYSTEQLLDLFNQGWRINIDRLYRVPHRSPHADLVIDWKHVKT